jgi:hypothetical protein
MIWDADARDRQKSKNQKPLFHFTLRQHYPPVARLLLVCRNWHCSSPLGLVVLLANWETARVFGRLPGRREDAPRACFSNSLAVSYSLISGGLVCLCEILISFES